MSANYIALLESFARHVGLLPEEFVKTGEVVVDSTTITLLHEANNDGGDVVYFRLLNAPLRGKECAGYRAALEANMLWNGTGGCTLGVLPQTGALALCGRVSINAVTGQSLAVLI